MVKGNKTVLVIAFPCPPQRREKSCTASSPVVKSALFPKAQDKSGATPTPRIVPGGENPESNITLKRNRNVTKEAGSAAESQRMLLTAAHTGPCMDAVTSGFALL